MTEKTNGEPLPPPSKPAKRPVGRPKSIPLHMTCKRFEGGGGVTYEIVDCTAGRGFIPGKKRDKGKNVGWFKEARLAELQQEGWDITLVDH